MAVDVAPAQRAPESVEQTRETWRRRIREAEAAQKPFHGIWATNLAFAAGQHWLVWNKSQRKLRSIQDEDGRYRDRELFTADRITEYRQAQLGELSSEDERPELLVAQAGEDAERIADLLNRLTRYAWDSEWEAGSALVKARRLCLDLGVSVIRCRWRPDEGRVTGYAVVGRDGQPVTDPQALEHLRAAGQLPDGSLPSYRPAREGRTRWEVYSAFQLVVPPGVVHEDDFPWEGVRKPVLVDDVYDTYGVRVREDTDIVNGIGLPASVEAASGQDSQGRLRDHAWLYSVFDRPSSRYPQGRSLVFAGGNLDLVDVQEGLPYQLGGEPHTGLVYLHWWRLADRFWSRAFTEALKDPQRVINRRKTQNVEVFDRGMPKLIVEQGMWPDTTGAPLEIVELRKGAAPPITMPGLTPNQAMYQDIATLDDDLSHASTLSQLRLGENPENVQTYGQLAILNDNEHGKRATVIAEHNAAKAALVELSYGDIRRYWPEQKQALVVGDDDRIEQVTFRKSEIPDEFRVQVAKGQPQPRSQGAEIKKIDAILAAAVETGAVAQDPAGWTAWYKRSLEAGSAQELPRPAPSSQQQLAHLENTLMRQGVEVEPAYYDQLQEHLPVHREEEDQARAAGDVELASRIERHIQQSLAAQQQAQQMAMQPTLAAAAQGSQPQQPGQGGPPIPSFVAQDLSRLAGGQ
jgi:hypothetical protein